MPLDFQRKPGQNVVLHGDIHTGPIANSEASSCELCKRAMGSRDSFTDTGSQNVQALSSPEPNQLSTKEAVCAESPDERVLDALGLLRCQRASPCPYNSIANSLPPHENLDAAGPSSASSGSLDMKKQKNGQKIKRSFAKSDPPSLAFNSVNKNVPQKESINELPEQEEDSPVKKHCNFHAPTKRKHIVPDSDEVESYGINDIPSEAQKVSVQPFAILLNIIQANQAACSVERGLSSPNQEPSCSKPYGSGSGRAAKERAIAKIREIAVKERSSMKKRFGSGSRRAAKKRAIAKICKITSKEKSSVQKRLGSGSHRAAKERAIAKICKIASKERSSMRKRQPVDTSFTFKPPAPKHAKKKAQKQARKQQPEPAKPAACKKGFGSDTTTKTVCTGGCIASGTGSFAGNIRIRCQKPSISFDKPVTHYDCSRCGFHSARMENIVRHYKRVCPYLKVRKH